ncbi:MAG: hypothetical protein ACRCYY_05790, partial [Trueperaceae bacterium]
MKLGYSVRLRHLYLLVLFLWLPACSPPLPSLSVSLTTALLTVGESVTFIATLRNTQVTDIFWESDAALSSTQGNTTTFVAQSEGTFEMPIKGKSQEGKAH